MCFLLGPVLLLCVSTVVPCPDSWRCFTLQNINRGNWGFFDIYIFFPENLYMQVYLSGASLEADLYVLHTIKMHG